MALHRRIAAEAVHIVAAGHKAAAHIVAGRMVGVEIHTVLAGHIVAVHIVVVHMVGAVVRTVGAAGQEAVVRIAAAFGLGLHTW